MANLTLDLTKKKSLVTDLLLDKGVRTAPTMRVDLALDISYSMSAIIAKGLLQKAVNQIMGIAVTFDDDGDIDVRKFDSQCDYVGVATVKDYADFVKRRGIEVRGSTSYSPIVESVIAHHFGGATVEVAPAKKGLFGFGSKPAVTKTVSADNTPVLSLIITDGECGDRDRVDRALKDAQAHNVYWHFVAVGNENFRTIKYLADKYPNVGEVYLTNFEMSDEEVYGQVICDELVQWVKRFEQPGRASA